MKPYLSLLTFAGALFLLSPQSAAAYFTSAQSAVALTPTTGLYTITYSFGLPKNDIFLPAATERNLRHGASAKLLGYTVRDDEGEVQTAGDTAAIVLSTAKLENGMYYVPAGSVATFVFTAFFRTDVQTPADEYQFQVENLPFPTELPDGFQTRSLNPSELTYYVTPTLTYER